MDNGKTVEAVTESWSNSGISGKAFITIAVIVISMMAFFGTLMTWGNVNQQRLTEAIEDSIEEQRKIDDFKDCVFDTYQETNDFYKMELLPFIGKTLTENNIVFPEELNIKLLKYQSKFEMIKTCLIDPGKVK
ncbi:hypothetical protein AMJ80_02440 [bacterium SM23_31]|nr:MAG: hypothetical protein AMJ80_02440 [bacterium SM23_31]